MVSSNRVECSFWTFSLVGISFLISYTQTQGIADPEVTILQGSLRGTIWTTNHGRNVSAFLGIPYAQPPIGNLRFANPVAADGWSGIRNASVQANACAQDSLGEEDCLYINVYTPQLPENTNSSLLPVMVFIHGGSFKRRSTSTDRFNPHYLLDEDVLLVLPQYRLGALGFLSTGDEVASGNWGLKDQILALKWVQNNIVYFGGDPDRVTLSGQSAGSVSVHLLTLSNATNGLFQNYITQSGSALAKWAYQPRESYTSRAFELGGYVDCFNDSSDSLISCLRKVNASEIIAAQSQFYVWHTLPGIVWCPTDEPDIEGAVLTDSPENLYATGKIRDLPWMTGVVRDEGLLHTEEFYGDEELFDEFLANIDFILPHMLSWTYQSDSGAAWVDAVKSYYFNNDLTGDTSVLLLQLTRLVSDALFFYPAHAAVQRQFALAENPQYLYTFNYKGTGSTGYGVSHTDEIFYLFSRISDGTAVNMSGTDLEIVDTMVQLWTSFVITGIPTISSMNDTVTWDSYSSQDNYLRIGNESQVSLEMQYSFLAERMQFWADLEASSDTAATVSASNTFYFTRILLLVSLLLCSQLVTAATTFGIRIL